MNENPFAPHDPADDARGTDPTPEQAGPAQAGPEQTSPEQAASEGTGAGFAEPEGPQPGADTATTEPRPGEAQPAPSQGSPAGPATTAAPITWAPWAPTGASSGYGGSTTPPRYPTTPYSPYATSSGSTAGQPGSSFGPAAPQAAPPGASTGAPATSGSSAGTTQGQPAGHGSSALGSTAAYGAYGYGTTPYRPSGYGTGNAAPGYGTSGYGTPGGQYPYPSFAATGPMTSGSTTAPAKRHTKGGRAAVVGVAIAALALASGFGGGLIGSSMAGGDSATSQGTLAPRATGQVASDTSSPSTPLGSVQQVAATVLPSVVSVVAMSQQGEGEGSGVVLTSSGLILTNNHVIDGAATLTVQFNDGTTANATVVGADPTDDLAVIRAAGVSGLTPAVLGSSADVRVGQQVVAIGSPLGLSATVTTGIVSALNRPVRTEQAQSPQAQGTVLSAIQTDAAINPGNSGGPLVDMSGRVIGINSAIAALSSSSDGQSGSIGVGFAIPIDQAYRIAQEIIDTGTATHAVLGASVTDAVDQSRGITTGAKIADITAGSGAAKAGLKAGDVVTKVGSVPIESADALVATIRSSAPGGTINLTYIRGGQPHTVSVTLGSSGK
jgi:putative serine protease PepD